MQRTIERKDFNSMGQFFLINACKFLALPICTYMVVSTNSAAVLEAIDSGRQNHFIQALAVITANAAAWSLQPLQAWRCAISYQVMRPLQTRTQSYIHFLHLGSWLNRLF
jgi:hypothetical protein